MHIGAADVQQENLLVQIDHASLLMHLESVLTMHMLCGTVSPEYTQRKMFYSFCTSHSQHPRQRYCVMKQMLTMKTVRLLFIK